jgi:hypothetical protein
MTNCEWYTTPKEDQHDAEHVLLYICPKEHIGEILFCQHHLFEWEEYGLDNRAWCSQDNCSEHIQEWTSCPIEHATREYLIRHDVHKVMR